MTKHTDDDVQIFITAIRDILTRFAIGTIVSLHVPNDPFDTEFWKWLSSNPEIPTQFIRDNMDKPWDFVCLSTNSNVTIKLIADFPNAGWDYWNLGLNPNITWDYVLENIDRKWEFSCLSENPTITIEVIKNHPKYDWHIGGFLRNPNATMDIIKSNHDLDWPELCTKQFAYWNPKATWKDIRDVLTIGDLSLWNINMCKSVTPEIVKTNPDIPWNPYSLGYNSNFTLTTILEMYPHVNGEILYQYYIFNPNITTADIIKYGLSMASDPASRRVDYRKICNTRSQISWGWLHVLSNPTIFDCKYEIRRVGAARVILKSWRNSISNPEFKLCKQRLSREFTELELA
jgi:hypothetical protein